VVGVIPARLGSERFPGKVLFPIRGRPLIHHVHDRLAGAGRIDAVLVATDDRSVAQAVSDFGGRALLIEEPCACGTDRVAAAVRGIRADIVVNLQGDQPLIDPDDIDRTVRALFEEPSLDMSTLAFPEHEQAGLASPDVVKVLADGRGRALYFTRERMPLRPAGDGKPLYLHHVGIYCFRREALERFASAPRGIMERRESLEQMRALEIGMSIGLVTTRRRTPAVDRRENVSEIASMLPSR
jgi:3-deoxy-manno-octulosonate cytidylyltransferase (CMP-KDO synthetase)